MRRGGAPSAGVVLNRGANKTNRGGSYGLFVLGIDRRFVIDEKTQAVMEQGQEVGRCAQKMFPGGLLIEAEHKELGKALEQTEQAVAKKQLPAVFEATFVHDKILARVA